MGKRGALGEWVEEHQPLAFALLAGLCGVALTLMLLSFRAPPERGPMCPGGRFMILGDTARDKRTGPLWRRAESAERMTWPEANRHCQSLAMRLPDPPDLADLIMSGPSYDEPFDPCAFPAPPATPTSERQSYKAYWTAGDQLHIPNLISGPDRKISIDGTLRGNQVAAHESERLYVRCVR